MTQLYTIDDYTQIAFNGVSYQLSDTVLSTIERLGKKIGISTIISPTEPHGSKHSRSTNNRKDRTSATWDKQKPFKTTTIVKKEGLDKIYTDIKGCLNKLSVKNYDIIKESLIEHIDSALKLSDEDSDIKTIKIANLIFDISCINKTFSELYAKLYRELVTDYPAFNHEIPKLKQKYSDGLDNIVNADPDLDYNNYCDVTKENDKRKSLSLFLVNLMINDLICKDEIVELMTIIIDKIVSFTDVAGQLFYIEEIIEVLSVYIKSSQSYLQDHSEWNNISNHIKEYSNYKAKEHVSISSRIIFKYMDLVEIITK